MRSAIEVTCATDRRCHRVTDDALAAARAVRSGRYTALCGPASEPHPRSAPKRCPVNRATVGWALSPLDFRAHAVTAHDDHPIGVLIARCGHRLPMVVEIEVHPPERRARRARWRLARSRPTGRAMPGD